MMNDKMHVYHDTRTGGYISGPREEVRSILGYGEEQWARYVRHANAQHPLAVKAAKNPGGLYLDTPTQAPHILRH